MKTPLSQTAADMWLAGFTPIEIKDYLQANGISRAVAAESVRYFFELNALVDLRVRESQRS